LIPPARALRRVLVTRASSKLVTRLRSVRSSSATWARRSPRASSPERCQRAGGVVDEQVVAGDVEDLGQAHDDVGAGDDAPAFVSADLGGVGAGLLGKFGLGPTVFFAQVVDAIAQGHDRVTWVDESVQHPAMPRDDGRCVRICVTDRAVGTDRNTGLPTDTFTVIQEQTAASSPFIPAAQVPLDNPLAEG
jgi:hypothetical protein